MKFAIKYSAGLLLLFLFIYSAGAAAQDSAADKYNPDNAVCGADNRGCVLRNLRASADQIEQDQWRDQVFREMAKSYASDGHIDVALSIIHDIKAPDTKAMTIRGIGMELAGLDLTKDQKDTVFTQLRQEADKITHAPSLAIALTYIAMSQAFAGDDIGAWTTASEMENPALRNKAYAETAEIQAEMKKYDPAMASTSKIDDPAFRNKAYHTVAKILADQGLFEESYKAAQMIDNPYKKAQSLQYMLDKQKQMENDKKNAGSHD